MGRKLVEMKPLTRLDVEYRESHDGDVWMSSVVLLLDGEETFAGIGSGGYIGLSPREIVEQQKLIEPGERPGRVILYRCDCGETGCGAVVARCYLDRDRVVWDRIDAGNPSPPNLNAPLFHRDAVVFDAEQYFEAMGRIKDIAARHPQ